MTDRCRVTEEENAYLNSLQDDDTEYTLEDAQALMIMPTTQDDYKKLSNGMADCEEAFAVMYRAYDELPNHVKAELPDSFHEFFAACEQSVLLEMNK